MDYVGLGVRGCESTAVGGASGWGAMGGGAAGVLGCSGSEPSVVIVFVWWTLGWGLTGGGGAGVLGCSGSEPSVVIVVVWWTLG